MLQPPEHNDVAADVCRLCLRPLADGEAVVQVVEDRFPAYDREIVLHTYHRACFHAAETLTHDCARCGCMFHLALIPSGRRLPQQRPPASLPLLRHGVRVQHGQLKRSEVT
jgi:hypothetical protein